MASLRRAVLAVAVLASGSALAAEKSAKAPQAVTDALAKRYPNAKVESVRAESEKAKGQPVWEAHLSESGSEMDVDLAADGTLISEERAEDPAKLPEAVTGAVEKSKYKGWKIDKAEKVTLADKPDQASYEVTVASGKKRMELVISSAGEIEKEEKAEGHKPGAAKREVEHAKSK